MTHEELLALLHGEVVKELQADQQRAEDRASAERALVRGALAAGRNVGAWTAQDRGVVEACIQRLQELQGCDCQARGKCAWCRGQLRLLLNDKHDTSDAYREFVARRLLKEWTRRSRMPPKVEGEDGE